MVYLIYGEDTFRSRLKLEAIKEKYRAASGDMNLIELSGEGISWPELQNQISAAPFLANKRLVIIKFISKAPADVREKLVEYLEKVPASTVLFFYEIKLDLRMNLFKKLCSYQKNCEEFQLLEPLQAKRWAEKRFKDNGLAIERPALDRLIELVGIDLWRMSNEIEKIICYKFGDNKDIGRVTIGDIDLLTNALPQANVFHLIDALHGRKLNQALSVLEDLMLVGEEELRLLGLIVSQFRNLLIVADLKDKFPAWNNFTIAKESGLKPFVVSKLLSQLRLLDKIWLKKSYQNLADVDWQIKTGAIEPHLGLNLLVLKVCGNFNTR